MSIQLICISILIAIGLTAAIVGYVFLTIYLWEEGYKIGYLMAILPVIIGILFVIIGATGVLG